MIANKTISGTEALLLERAIPLREVSAPENVAKWLRPVTSIVVLAWGVRLMSLFNIVYALLRYQPPLIFWLGKWVPFEITEGNRFRMLLVSVLLLTLASGLQRGKRLAWQLTIAGLMLAPILHLGRGVIWPQALINLTLVGFLLLHRCYFVAKSDPKSIRFAFITCPLLAATLVIFGTVRLHALHKDLDGDHSWAACAQTSVELVFVHHSHAQVPTTHHTRDLFRVLRMGGTMTALVGLVLVCRPVLTRRRSRAEHREKARRIIAQHGDDPFDPYALLSDKSYFFTANGRVVVPYVQSGKLAVVLADPIGPISERPGAIMEFAVFCRNQDWEPVFYEIKEELSIYYEQAGFAVFKIGEEARLRQGDFDLKGRDFQNLRTARNMAHKTNLQFHWYDASEGIDESLERQLEDVSRHWLEEKKAHEMTFDMGAFSLEDIRRDGAGVAIDPKGRVLAFATWRPFGGGTGRCLDLMRSQHHARNVMDYVLVESIIRFHQQGIHDISLGSAPLANANVEPGHAQAEDKAVLFLYRNLNRIYAYKSLFEFKRKYRPQWRGRYIAYHRGIHLPLVGLALVRVHSPGAIWRFLVR